MGAHIFTFLMLLIFCLSAHAFPTELSGIWIQPNRNETGVMLVRVDEHNENTIIGVLEIRGSKDCPQPVAFMGKIEEKRVLIESTAHVVCGYGGRLTATVTKDGDDVYVGDFRYTYTMLGFVFTWASGTFRLSAMHKQKE